MWNGIVKIFVIQELDIFRSESICFAEIRLDTVHRTLRFSNGLTVFFSLFSFPHLVSLPPPSTRMSSSPSVFPNDFDASISPDAFSSSSHLSATPNSDFLPALDAGFLPQPSVRDFGGFFPPNDRVSHSSRQTPVFSDSSVRIFFCLLSDTSYSVLRSPGNPIRPWELSYQSVQRIVKVAQRAQPFPQ
jgi:hypothetical protein